MPTQKKNEKNRIVAFRVDVSREVGIGHLKRLIVLKEKMKIKNNFWLVKGDKKIFFNFIKKDKYVFFSKSENRMISFLKKKKIDKVIMDISHQSNLNNNNIFYIQKNYINNKLKIISFDDPKQKIISDISIIPYVVTDIKLKTKQNSIVFSGPSYFLHKIKKNKSNLNKIKNILIVISGTDPKNIGFKIYKTLENLKYNFKTILGENYEELKKNNVKNIVKRNHHFIKRSKNLNKELSWSDLVICGEGHIKYESIFANRPTVIVNQFERRNILVDKFKQLNICHSVGSYKQKRKKLIRSSILNYILNKKKRIYHKNNSNKYFNQKINSKDLHRMIKRINTL